MLERVATDLRALPPGDRRRIAESLRPASASPCRGHRRPARRAGKADLSARLSEALGAPVAPEFRVDPALIAGVELRFPSLVLRRAWSEDLKRIQAELIHDDDAQRVA